MCSSQFHNTTVIRTDLHTHSTFSDGTQSPSTIVRTANDSKIEVVSLTDHDTVLGTDEAITAADELGMTFISGVEVSAKFPHGSMHILGYKIDHKDKNLLKMLDTLQFHRRQRNHIIIEKLQYMGMDVSQEELEESVGVNTVIGRPHIATLLVKKKYAANFHDAFNRFLGENKPAYIPKEIYEFEEIIQSLKDANGVVFLAHPVTLNLTETELECLLLKMKTAGMDGIEVWNSKHTRTFNKKLLEIAQKHDLAVSGGSDYHGALNSNVKMGQDYYGKWITKNKLSDILFS